MYSISQLRQHGAFRPLNEKVDSDGFLKPLFLGRGMSTPMLVILLGAIGGMITSGIIGLFVGAIILALGYELFMKWLNDEQETVEQS